MSTADRARALLWWIGRDDATQGLQIAEICSIIEAAGHPEQNQSRLMRQLVADKRHVSRVPGNKAWRLHPRGRAELNTLYNGVVAKPQSVNITDSVLPRALVAGTRSYLEKVVHQINASYDVGLYDCCAVMCRRLLETLIIEVYEHDGRTSEITGPDGHFYMFADLLRVLTRDAKYKLSRNGQQGLEDFKKIGDLSAHNRRFNAQRPDIDRIQSGIRVASEELLHLAKLA